MGFYSSKKRCRNGRLRNMHDAFFVLPVKLKKNRFVLKHKPIGFCTIRMEVKLIYVK